MGEENETSLGEEVYEIIVQILKALVADFVEPGKGPSEEEMMAAAKDFLEGLPPLHRRGLAWMVRAVEVSPLTMGFRHRFSHLSRKEQVEVLERYEKSGNYLQRGMILGLKSLLLIVFYSLPRVEELLGYDYKCLLEVKEGGRG